jgi:hypothetical protein
MASPPIKGNHIMKRLLFLALCIFAVPAFAQIVNPDVTSGGSGAAIHDSIAAHSIQLTFPDTTGRLIFVRRDSAYVANEYRGNNAFTTTSVRAAIYQAGIATTFSGVAIPRNENGTTLPVAGDFLSVYCKTDSIIILRPAGTTSDLKFNYIVWR